MIYIKKIYVTYIYIYIYMGFPGGTVVENLFANAGDTGDLGLIPGLGRAPGEGNGNPLSILAWKIPWTEEPGGPQSMGLQTVGHDWPHTHPHTHTQRGVKNCQNALLLTGTLTTNFNVGLFI